MATVLEPEKTSSAADRFVICGVDWEAYDAISRALGNRPTRVTFDGENLEFTSPSPIHEWYSHQIARFLEALALELDLPLRSGGSTTMKRRAIERGLEPDQCFWIQSESAVRGQMDLDLLLDHPPDLAIEIEVSRSALDRLAIYARLRIPEVWTFDGELLRVLVLRTDGSYVEESVSRCLPQLPVQEMVPFLHPDPTIDDTTRVRRFVAQVRPRFN